MTSALALAIALVLPAVAGLALVAAAFGRPAACAQEWIARVAMGTVTGLGISSLVAFAWLFAAGGIGSRYPILDGAVCLLLLGGLLASPRTRRGLRVERIAMDDGVATAILLAAVGLALWRFAAETRAMPLGYWDAWEIWNFRARHILRAGDAWRSAFAPDLKATEYPLLLPLSVARLWAYAGESAREPAILAGIFTMGCALATAGLVAAVSGAVPGATAGLLVLGTGSFQWWGPRQYADVPLATFLVSAGGVLALASRATSDRRLLHFLGGLLLGLAGWTKTDGVVAAAVLAMAFLVAEGLRDGRLAAGRAAAGVAAGALLPALAWVVQHTVLAPAAAPALTGAYAGLGAKLVDPHRWRLVLGYFARLAPGAAIGLPVIAIAIALLEALRPGRLLRSPAMWSVVVLLLLDLLVFLTTPLDLEFHLVTAADRLLLQSWPLLLLALFSAVESPRPATDDAPARPQERPGGSRARSRPPRASRRSGRPNATRK